MQLSSLYRHTREVPVAWQNALWQIAPPSEKLSWLLLRWEPGDVWEPVQRWIVWQMRPMHLIRPEVLAELKGPDPRKTGHYCGEGYCICRHKLHKWKGGAARMIDRAQWQIFQETGALGSRWWTIQGDKGGHRFRLDQVESRTSLIMGGAKDTPAPGALPYADFDSRVFFKIAEMDRVRAWKHLISFIDRDSRQMDSEEMDAKVEAQKLLWGWLETQTGNSLDSITRNEWSEFREASPRILGQKDTTDYEAVQQEFITNPNY